MSCLHVIVSFKRERVTIRPDPDQGVHLKPGFPSVPQVTHRLAKKTRKFWMMWNTKECSTLSQCFLTYSMSYLQQMRFASGLNTAIKIMSFNFLVQFNTNIDFKRQTTCPAKYFFFTLHFNTSGTFGNSQDLKFKGHDKLSNNFWGFSFVSRFTSDLNFKAITWKWKKYILQ